jgi:uncharacterized RDD family membrane protein YckC
MFENESQESALRDSGTPAWKQEVNQRLAAHRNRRVGSQEAVHAQESPRAASGRAAEAAARVAARYAKAPSYSELLAGEARAVVRAAGEAAEAARNAQAAAQAVLAGLESGAVASGTWEPASQGSGPQNSGMPHAAPARWQDKAPEEAYVAAQESPGQKPPAQKSAVQKSVVQESAARESRRELSVQPRWEETLPVSSSRDVWSEMRVNLEPGYERPDYERSDVERPGYGGRSYERSSEEGELFPFDVVADATVEPVQHLPANLIEFPRELVATRKARPRLAEGPFYDASRENSQLSIFEVDPALLDGPVYLSDMASATVAPPEWASIELDHRPEPEYAENGQGGQAYAHAAEIATITVETPLEAATVSVTGGNDLPQVPGGLVEGMQGSAVAVSPAVARRADEVAAVELLVAPMSDRLLAGVVDGALVTLAFLAAAVVVIASSEHPPTGRIALIAAGCGLIFFGLLYEWLFLSYAEEGTPGMRYARIALCTFDDDNPTVEQMRMRIPALVMAAAPAGLGLVWALFDGERLGWHDRWTRTYQRKY